MISENFEAGVKRLHADFGAGEWSDRVLEDEHVRLGLYRAAFGDSPVDSLVPTILTDPDVAMADAVLVELVDHVASMQTVVGFRGWSRRALDAGMGQRSFPSVRVHEWTVLLSVDELASEQLATLLVGSDWLQRNAVERSGVRTVLEELASGARTRRVRVRAKERLRSFDLSDNLSDLFTPTIKNPHR